MKFHRSFGEDSSSILTDERLLSLTVDYHNDGYAEAEIFDMLISDGFNSKEAQTAISIIIPFQINTNSCKISCISSKGQKHHWCPKYKALIEHGTCDTIQCSHLMTLGENHINCGYKKEE